MLFSKIAPILYQPSEAGNGDPRCSFLVGISTGATALMMALAAFCVAMMSIGLLVRERGMRIAAMSPGGSATSLQARKTIEAGNLLCILTAPWLLFVGIWIS